MTVQEHVANLESIYLTKLVAHNLAKRLFVALREGCVEPALCCTRLDTEHAMLAALQQIHLVNTFIGWKKLALDDEWVVKDSN